MRILRWDQCDLGRKRHKCGYVKTAIEQFLHTSNLCQGPIRIASAELSAASKASYKVLCMEVTMIVKLPVMAGHHLLKNRMVKAPIHSETCVGGKVTPETEKHYEDRTKGGRFGLVIVEHSYVRNDGMASPTQLSSSRDSDIDGLKRLAEIIHQNGSAAILQINHAGCGASRSFTGEATVSPSGVRVTCGWPTAAPQPDIPEVLTTDGILRLEEAYLHAAVRAMKAGFDGIFHADLEDSTGFGVHGSFPELFAVHFAETLVTLNGDFGRIAVRIGKFSNILVTFSIAESVIDFHSSFR